MAINEAVMQLSTKIQSKIELDSKNKTLRVDEGIYEGNLPEGLTMTVVNKVGEYNTDFVAASAHAIGQIAVKAMAKDSGYADLTATIPMGGKDSVTHTIQREKTYNNSLSGDGATTTKHGVVTTTLEVKAGKNGGQLKAVRADIGSFAAEQFK